MFKVEDFSAIFSDWNPEVELNSLKEEFIKSNLIQGEKLIYILFDYVKRRVKFIEILKHLKEVNKDFKLT